MYLNVHPYQIQYFKQIYGDQKRFEQILLNFASNALKFSNENGLVKIELLINNFFKINDKLEQNLEYLKELQKNQNLIQVIQEFKEKLSKDNEDKDN